MASMSLKEFYALCIEAFGNYREGANAHANIYAASTPDIQELMVKELQDDIEKMKRERRYG